MQAVGGLRRGRFLLLRKMADSGGGGEAGSFPKEVVEHNPGGATKYHLGRIAHELDIIKTEKHISLDF